MSLKSFNTAAQFQELFSVSKTRTLLIIGGFFYVGLNIWQFNVSVFFKDVFEWGPQLIGGVFVLIGVFDILSRVVILPRLLKILSEKTVGSLGLVALSCGLGLLFISAFFPHVALIFPAIALIVVGEGLFDPTYSAQLSLSVSEQKQGSLQGVNQSLQAFYRVIIPLVAGAIYVLSHGAVFGIAAAVIVLGLILFSGVRPIKRKNSIKV